MTSCPECQTAYHVECWEENHGCAVYGCGQVPAIESRTALEIPIAYWGQEHKPCPVCQKEILAAAVRCRHCGSVFQTARPLDAAEFANSSRLEALSPRLRKTIIWIFILCLIPGIAPVAVIGGWIWFHSNRDGIDTLPSLYPALIKIGLGVGALQTVAMVTAAILFSVIGR